MNSHPWNGTSLSNLSSQYSRDPWGRKVRKSVRNQKEGIKKTRSSTSTWPKLMRTQRLRQNVQRLHGSIMNPYDSQLVFFNENIMCGSLIPLPFIQFWCVKFVFAIIFYFISLRNRIHHKNSNCASYRLILKFFSVTNKTPQFTWVEISDYSSSGGMELCPNPHCTSADKTQKDYFLTIYLPRLLYETYKFLIQQC